MKMSVFSCAALCLTVCAASSLMKDNGDIRLALSVLTVCVLFLSVSAGLTDIGSMVSKLIEKTGLDEIYMKVIFKGLGICYISKLSSDCCRDSGNTALGTQLEIVGKITMTVISLPLFRAVIEIIEALLT